MAGECFHLFQLCNLVPLQRYTKSLSTLQRSSLVEKSRQKPLERMNVLSDVSVSIASAWYFVGVCLLYLLCRWLIRSLNEATMTQSLC